MGANGKRKSSGHRSTAVILVPPNTTFRKWVERSGDASISIGSINEGRIVLRLDIDFVQVSFTEKGSVVLRVFGKRRFVPFLEAGVALAVTDRKGNLVLNRHVCPACFENAGQFARQEKRKIKLREEEGASIYLFECALCKNQWEVPFQISKPNGNGNGNGNGNYDGNGHHFGHVMRKYTFQYLDLKPQRRRR